MKKALVFLGIWSAVSAAATWLWMEWYKYMKEREYQYWEEQGWRL